MNDMQEKLMENLASADSAAIRQEQKAHQGKVLSLLGSMKDGQMTSGMLALIFNIHTSTPQPTGSAMLRNHMTPCLFGLR
jgi:hypothetical protein